MSISDDTVCPPEWFGWRGSCYYYDLTGSTYRGEPHENCQQLDALLAVPNTEDELDMLWEILQNMPYLSPLNFFYLGMSSENYDHYYWSVDGSIIPISPGISINANNLEERYVRLFTGGGKMMDGSYTANANNQFICERRTEGGSSGTDKYN